MDQALADLILSHLQAVAEQRRLREAAPGLAQRVQDLKLYQQRRFANTYADLLLMPRYEHATRFFLKELYGPGDYTRRDAQFARVVPTLVRIFPAEVVATVAKLASLHGLSERLDTQMARLLPAQPISASAYRLAWRQCGDAAGRQEQIDSTLAVGAALEQLTRKPLLRQALRVMRGPATAAGMAELQAFLESGFDTFKAMKGAADFLQTIREREQALAEALFAPDAPGPAPAQNSALLQLP